MDVMSLGSSEQEQEIQLVDSEEDDEQNGQCIQLFTVICLYSKNSELFF